MAKKSGTFLSGPGTLGDLLLLGGVATLVYFVYKGTMTGSLPGAGVQSTIPNEAGVLSGIDVATGAIPVPVPINPVMPPVPVPPPGLGWLW
jgi:hypothetical protein